MPDSTTNWFTILPDWITAIAALVGAGGIFYAAKQAKLTGKQTASIAKQTELAGKQMELAAKQTELLQIQLNQDHDRSRRQSAIDLVLLCHKYMLLQSCERCVTFGKHGYRTRSNPNG